VDQFFIAYSLSVVKFIQILQTSGVVLQTKKLIAIIIISTIFSLLILFSFVLSQHKTQKTKTKKTKKLILNT